MNNSNEPDQLPTREQIVEMAQDMVRHLPTNSTETWVRILYRLSLVASPTWTMRIVWATETIRRGLPYRIEREKLIEPVNQAEGYRLGRTGHRMPLTSTLFLHAIVTAVEQEIGADHIEFVPVRWFRRGMADRSKEILQYGGDDEINAE